VVGTDKNIFLPNDGFMVMNPMVESEKNILNKNQPSLQSLFGYRYSAKTNSKFRPVKQVVAKGEDPLLPFGKVLS